MPTRRLSCGVSLQTALVRAGLAGVGPMSSRQCNINDETCSHGKFLARGWCRQHYDLWRRHGDPTWTPDPPKVCSWANCEDRANRGGLCRLHSDRQRAGSDMDRPRRSDHLGRLLARVDQNGPVPHEDSLAAGTGPCWVFSGKTNKVTGYGRISLDGQHEYIHRASYRLHGGALVEDMTIDHLCHNGDPDCPSNASCIHRRCVNPRHLEQVPTGENSLRGNGYFAQNARKTHCSNGHEFTTENTATTKSGYRRCRACGRAHNHLSKINTPAYVCDGLMSLAPLGPAFEMEESVSLKGVRLPSFTNAEEPR
jgi:hypothetical protein